VNVARAERSDIATYLTLDGQIAPKQESTLALPQSGNVVRVDVVLGQRVHAGQELAKLDDSTLRANLATAQAQIAQSLATLSKTKLLDTANTEQYQQTVSQDKNNVLSAQQALKNAELVYNQNQELFKQGFASQTAFEQARTNYVAAQQALQSAQDKLRQDTAALSNIPAYKQTIAQTEAALEQARAQAQLYRTQIAQTTLVAPYDGVITQRLLDPGAYASPNQPIVRISQIDPVYVNVNVPDDDLKYVHPGTRVSFTTSTNPNRTYTATVASVNATPTQGTLSYQAQIVMPNPDNSLRGGQLVSVTVLKDVHRNTIVVPRSAVFVGDRGANVFTVGPDNKARAVPVEVGLQTDTLSEVLSPQVRPGTVVITTRPDALQNGSLVAIANPGPSGRLRSGKPDGQRGGQPGNSPQ
jgi:HlyD family secretion protein